MEGLADEILDGFREGGVDGASLGLNEGLLEGLADGISDGFREGGVDGASLGLNEGLLEGLPVRHCPS
jgi:hypothetical protein